MSLSSNQLVSITSKFVIFMISIKIEYAFTGIETLNSTMSTIIYKVLIAPQSN